MNARADVLARAYCDQVLTAAIAATEGGGGRERSLLVGGRAVTLRTANHRFETIMLRALLHLESPTPAGPELTVFLWDSASTGIELPPWPWQVPAGDPWYFRTPTLRAAYVPETNSVLVLHRERKQAAFWTNDVADLPIVERGSPLLRLWAWWLGVGVVQFTHAGAVANHDGAALLLGPGGSGKSTTALHTLRSRLLYLADDYCLIRAKPVPTVYSLYSSAKVNASERPQFPWLEETFAGIDADKSLFQLHPTWRESMVGEKPLRMLLACRVSGRSETRAVPISAAEAIRTSAPSTIVQLHRVIDPAAALRTMTQIAAQVPAFRLDLGTRKDVIPEILGELLDR